MATIESIARSDRDQQGSALCQEVRALPVDTLVERLLLDALAQDRIAIALEAVGQLEEESRQLERQWTLRRERARYEAERAWRQYDAVEPENRLVARSLELGREAARRRSYRAGACALAVGGTARDRRSGPRKAASPRREPAANLACCHHVGGRPEAHSTLYRARSCPRSETGPWSGVPQDRLADRRD